MAVIAKITVQKRNKERYNIFLDHGQGEEYAFSVDEVVLISHNLKKGLEIDKAELEKIIYEDHIRKGYQQAINFLSYRMRSTKEVADYLEKKEIEEEVSLIIQRRLQEQGYLNDNQFAKAFVQSRVNLALKGPIKIKQELIEKGVSEKDIEDSLTLFNEEDQIVKAIKLIEKNDRAKARISKKEQYRKTYINLLSKGFSKEVIDRAIALFDEQNSGNSNQDLEAITYQGDKACKKYKNYQGWEKKMKVKQFLYSKGFSIDLIDQYLEKEEER